VLARSCSMISNLRRGAGDGLGFCCEAAAEGTRLVVGRRNFGSRELGSGGVVVAASDTCNVMVGTGRLGFDSGTQMLDWIAGVGTATGAFTLEVPASIGVCGSQLLIPFVGVGRDTDGPDESRVVDFSLVGFATTVCTVSACISSECTTASGSSEFEASVGDKLGSNEKP
jgi:hypothetical protein